MRGLHLATQSADVVFGDAGDEMRDSKNGIGAIILSMRVEEFVFLEPSGAPRTDVSSLSAI